MPLTKLLQNSCCLTCGGQAECLIPLEPWTFRALTLSAWSGVPASRGCSTTGCSTLIMPAALPRRTRARQTFRWPPTTSPELQHLWRA